MKTIHQKYIYLVLAMIPVIIGIAEIFALFGSPYMGLDFKHIQDKWYISSVAANGPAKMYPEFKGKEIVAIGEWHVGKSDLTKIINEIIYPDEYGHFWDTQQYLWEHVQPGRPVTITLMVNDTPQQYTITPSSVTGAQVFSTILSVIYISVLITLIIGLVVVWNKPENEAARVFFFLTFAIGLYTITSGLLFNRFLTFEPVLFKSLYLVSVLGVLLVPAVLHFALVFPRRNPIMRYKFIIWLMYLIIVVLGIIFLFRLSFIAYQIAVISQLFYLFGAVGIAIYNYLQVRSLIEKAQMKWVVFAFVIVVLSGCFVILEQVFFSRFDIHIVMMIFPVLPLSMAFAIMRYKLMDIDTLFDNTLIYSVTIGLLALIDMAVVYILTSNRIPLLVFREPFPTIIAVWVIIFTYIPVRNRVRDVVRQLLRREIYDLNEVSISFGKSLLAVQAISGISEMTKQVITKTLHPRGVDMDLFPTPQPVRPLINTDDGGALIPLLSSRGALGVISLQRKYSDRLYDRNDIKLLDMISNQAALAIESIRYREELHRKEDEARKEKERILKDIHDGIGGITTNINILAMIAHNKSKEETQNILSSIVDLSKESLFEMRHLYNTIMYEKELAWADFINDIKKFASNMLEPHSIKLNIQVNIPDSGEYLSSFIYINLYKIFKEAISNIVKYSGARQVNIILSINENKIMLTIHDDGKGLGDGNKQGKGMRNMAERTKDMGGTITIKSHKGTLIDLEIPIKYPMQNQENKEKSL